MIDSIEDADKMVMLNLDNINDSSQHRMNKITLSELDFIEHDIGERVFIDNAILRIENIFNNLMKYKEFRIAIGGKSREGIKATLLYMYLVYNNHKLTQTVIAILYNSNDTSLRNHIKLLSKTKFNWNQILNIHKSIFDIERGYNE